MLKNTVYRAFSPLFNIHSYNVGPNASPQQLRWLLFQLEGQDEGAVFLVVLAIMSLLISVAYNVHETWVIPLLNYISI